MALVHLRPVDRYVVDAELADISTAGSAFTVAIGRGIIKKVYSVIHGEITGAPAVWTVEVNGVAVVGISVSVTHTSSAAGDVDEGEPTTLATAYVNEGDTIEFVNAAGSTGTVPVTFYAVIERI